MNLRKELTPQELHKTEILSGRVAEEMRRIKTFKFKRKILAEAFVILQELGEIELSNRLLTASKRLGDKLKNKELPG